MDMKVLFPGGKRADVVYKGFTIRTDQPKRSGGDGSAPQPFDLFLASIGACTGVYVLSFCEERGISTEGLSLTLRTEKNDQTKMVDKITIEILIPPEFPERYKKAVVRAAELCAVTKHLFTPPEFEIRTTTREDPANG